MSLTTTVEKLPAEVYALAAPAHYARYEGGQRDAIASATGHRTLTLGSDPDENKLCTYYKIFEPPWTSVVMVRLPGDWSLHWCFQTWGPYLYAHAELPDGRPAWVRLDRVEPAWRPWGSVAVLSADETPEPPFPPDAIIFDLASGAPPGDL